MDAISGAFSHGLGVRRIQSCVVVCGLHRSGTSAVTRLINLLGADIASDLLPNNPDNSRGYWESHAVVGIHKRLLAAVAASPDDPFDPLPLRANWLATDAAREAKRQLANLIRCEFADSRLFVVKDPRISRLLPLWIELLHEFGVAPIVVVPFRNPLEVAASLAQRDQVPLPKTLLLYFHAYLEIEFASRDTPRLFVRYDRLLQDWHSFAQRAAHIPGTRFSPPSESARRVIDEFLTADLYHHRFSRRHMTQNETVHAAIVEIFDRMSETAETGDERALRSSFDRLRASAEAASCLYSGYLISQRREMQHRLTQMRESFESSNSWRVTAPLRRLKRLLLRASAASLSKS